MDEQRQEQRVVVGGEGVALPPTWRDELFDVIRTLGYEPEPGEVIEERRAGVPLVILLWLAKEIASPVAQDLARSVGRWLWRKVKRQEPPARVRVIYGPDKEVLAEVLVDDSLEEE